MRTVPLKQVFQGVSALLGAELVQPGSPDFVGIMAAINTWVETGWKYDFWPEWTPVERRAYRDAWNETDTYAAGTEVFFEDDETYYEANSAPNNPAAGESPETDPDKWTEITTLRRYIALEQTGQTPIDTVKRVCRRDPEVYPENPGELRFDITHRGIVPDNRAGARVYVEFRKRPPVFSSDEYDAETTYQAGDVVFSADTWECYKALQATTGNGPTALAYWEHVKFPYLLKRFVEQACYAATLKPDGQGDKAADELQVAYGFLIQTQDEVFGQQGQSDVVRAVTY
jgi:hypothetical protein